MFPPAFDYHRAGSIDEALDLLAGAADRDPRLLAGGHSLLPRMKRGEDDPGVVVDLGGVDDLRGVTVTDSPDDGARPEIEIGALTTYADALESPLGEHRPGFAEAVAAVGDPQIRNRGTVGGNLAAADHGADLPPAALAADVTLVVRNRDGAREIPATDFFLGDGETALDQGDLLTAVRLPGSGAGVQSAHAATGSAYVKRTHPATGYAMVGVAVAVAVDAGEVAEARVAVTGVFDRPRHLPTVEDAVVGEPARDPALATVADRAGAGVDEETLRGDAHASGAFRASVLPTYVERALSTAIDRATGESGAGDPTAATNGGDPS